MSSPIDVNQIVSDVKKCKKLLVQKRSQLCIIF